MKRDLNEYLYFEFGMDEDVSSISDSWPFDLRQVGKVSDETIYEFESDGERFYAWCGRKLSFQPAYDFNLDDLRLQEKGSEWIAEGTPWI